MRTLTTLTLLLVALAMLLPLAHAEKATKNGPDEAAVKRTRKTVRMLDDIYKTAVVLITDKYVHDESDFPAGGAAVAWFGQISEKGWHDVRLIDVTGQPVDDENVARDDFEKEGVKRLRSGETYYDQVVEKDGEYRLCAVTNVPVVMKKCVMCHDNYADVKEGAAIGAISYSIPIE